MLISDTARISGLHNEEIWLREFDIHKARKSKRSRENFENLDRRTGTERNKVIRETKRRKLWRFMIAHVMIENCI